MLSLYRLVSGPLGGPVISAFMRRRLAAGKEDPERFGERQGKADLPRPHAQRLVWVHAASVGESLSMLPLIEHLLAADAELAILMTTGTVSSAGLMAERLPPGAIHQYVPLDRPRYVRRFLDHWRPDLVLWAESEFWPNLILETTGRGTPMILINGRISPRSYSSWKRARGIITKLLRRFDLCLGQSEEDAERLRQLGAPNVDCLGNMKFAVPPLPADKEELAGLEADFGGRPNWLAASTHEGEERIAAETHSMLAEAHPELLTVIVPRHAQRGDEVAAMLRAMGFDVAQRSAGQPIQPHTQIYLADSMGELGLFFRLAPIVFMGKSLVPLGGQNPLEALHLDCAVLHGPHMMNFTEIGKDMAAAGCALEVADRAALATGVGALLDDRARAAGMAEKGRAYASSSADVTERVAARVLSYLQPAAAGEADAAA
ncbi:MAG: 3-deoxy-D-manno-octulosonic acid transferase [Rhodospirillales bacterium]